MTGSQVRVPYLAAGRTGLGDDADRLQFRFSVVALVSEPDVQDAFLKSSGCTTMWERMHGAGIRS